MGEWNYSLTLLTSALGGGEWLAQVKAVFFYRGIKHHYTFDGRLGDKRIKNKLLKFIVGT